MSKPLNLFLNMIYEVSKSVSQCKYRLSHLRQPPLPSGSFFCQRRGMVWVWLASWPRRVNHNASTLYMLPQHDHAEVRQAIAGPPSLQQLVLADHVFGLVDLEVCVCARACFIFVLQKKYASLDR